jgi:hypothetical protein
LTYFSQITIVSIAFGQLAQLDRVLASEAKGRAFESRIAHPHRRKADMANLEPIIEKLNSFLIRQNLPKIAGTPIDLESLYGAVLASIWKNPDKKKREDLAFAVAGELRKLFGGKNLEEIYDKTRAKLDAQEDAVRAKAASRPKAVFKKDANAVPSFEELFGDNKKK